MTLEVQIGDRVQLLPPYASTRGTVTGFRGGGDYVIVQVDRAATLLLTYESWRLRPLTALELLAEVGQALDGA